MTMGLSSAAASDSWACTGLTVSSATSRPSTPTSESLHEPLSFAILGTESDTAAKQPKVTGLTG